MAACLSLRPIVGGYSLYGHRLGETRLFASLPASVIFSFLTSTARARGGRCHSCFRARLPFGDYSAPRPRPRLAKYCLPRVVRRALGPARPAATCDSPRWRSHHDSRLSAARCDRAARCDPLDCGERAAPPPEFYPARGPCLAAPPLGLPLLDHRGGGRLRSAPRRTPRRSASRARVPGSDPPFPLHQASTRPRCAADLPPQYYLLQPESASGIAH